MPRIEINAEARIHVGEIYLPTHEMAEAFRDVAIERVADRTITVGLSFDTGLVDEALGISVSAHSAERASSENADASPLTVSFQPGQIVSLLRAANVVAALIREWEGRAQLDRIAKATQPENRFAAIPLMKEQPEDRLAAAIRELVRDELREAADR